MTGMVYSAPDWELEPKARNTSAGEAEAQRKADWARSHLSSACLASLFWDGSQSRLFESYGRSCDSHRATHEGLLDFPLVSLVFSSPTWQDSLLPRRRMGTCSYC